MKRSRLGRKSGKKKVRLPKVKLWAVYDEQTNQYLYSGRNVKTLNEAVDQVWSFWIGCVELEPGDRKKVGKWTLAQKKDWLENTQGFRFEQVDKGEVKED
jgi:hypothetical protein